MLQDETQTSNDKCAPAEDFTSCYRTTYSGNGSCFGTKCTRIFEYVSLKPVPDFVVDGMNMGQTQITTRQNKRYTSWGLDKIQGIVNHFEQRGKYVTVIAKSHIVNNSRTSVSKDMDKLVQGNMFTIHSSLDDDLYVLYAAIKSGLRNPRMYLLTNDLLRDHKWIAELHDSVGKDFARWQQARQATAFVKNSAFRQNVSDKSSGFFVRYPPRFEERTHVNRDGRWHIPGPHNTWLCVRPSQNSKEN
eukprot:m.219217 g.219217  ORF g.219217 m.219217 type:complete len:246 (+) comp15913_c1_seq15:1106-1843(+)